MPWSELLLLLIGGVGGYFGKRWIEGAPKSERINRMTQLVELHSKLKESGMTVEQLRLLEGEVLGRSSRLRVIEDAVLIAADPATEPEARDSIIAELDLGAATQLGMNLQAESSLGRTREILQAILNRMASELEPEEMARVESSQRAWERYSEEQATLDASLYEGGTMKPLVYSSSLEQLTAQRIAELRDYLNVKDA